MTPKRAYSYLYKTTVEIISSHRDDLGGLIYVATFQDPESNRVFERYLFRPHELEQYMY
jgi:hypothetical protein